MREREKNIFLLSYLMRSFFLFDYIFHFACAKEKEEKEEDDDEQEKK